MALSQLFWDVLMPWNLKSTYFSLKMIHFLSLNIWYVIYVVFWIKYWNLKLPHHCILFLFTISTVSQLFWNRVCTYYVFFSQESASSHIHLNSTGDICVHAHKHCIFLLHVSGGTAVLQRSGCCKYKPLTRQIILLIKGTRLLILYGFTMCHLY